MIGNKWSGTPAKEERLVRVIKDEDDQHERWVVFRTVRDITIRIDNIEQPNPERQALSGFQRPDKGINYTYADELSRKINFGIVFTVICSILTTPVALLCFIPMILHLRKVCHDLQKLPFPVLSSAVVAKTKLLGLPMSGLCVVIIGPSRLYIKALALLWVTSVCSLNSWPLTWSTTDVSSQLMGGDLLHMLCYSWLCCHLRAENGSIKYRIHVHNTLCQNFIESPLEVFIQSCVQFLFHLPNIVPATAAAIW